MDRTVHPPRPTKLEYLMHGWLGDDLLETLTTYVATERVTRAFEAAKLTGFELDDVEMSKSSEFLELFADVEIPPFRWLKITGRPGVDDFGISPDNQLVISDAVIGVLRSHTFAQAKVQELGAGPPEPDFADFVGSWSEDPLPDGTHNIERVEDGARVIRANLITKGRVLEIDYRINDPWMSDDVARRLLVSTILRDYEDDSYARQVDEVSFASSDRPGDRTVIPYPKS